MKKLSHIIKFHEIDPNTIPNYYEYGFVINRIKKKLFQEFGFEFKMYADEETTNEIWEILEEDLQSNKNEVNLISYIFDGIETSTISSNHTQERLELLIKPRITNALYYYPNYNVALARTPIFQNHSEMDHDFILAKDNNCMVGFLEYVLERKREYIRNHVTVFTDTEDGVDNKKEKITTLVTREEVFLEENLKKEIYRSIDEFFSKSGSFFKTYNIPYKRGVLLYGKPGNGKTTLVKSIANSITAPVAYWQITEFTSSYSIHEVFSTVAKMAPMVLVIEDIDSMPEAVRSVFLNTLDGATSKEGIFLIGTTNYPEKIDPALINRAGRFDRAYEIKLPTEDLRYGYLLKKGMDQFISLEDVEKVVKETKGFSFAQLNELYTSIALQWHYDRKVNIDLLCSELQSDNKNSKKRIWDSELDSYNLGFRV
ncbi:ATP-binding protein [Bacillus sp. B15-48]|uniref:ATP-binding protein n=1 Tax=Bacillus sp. B15-48 TaxID=1548601 RepID=UPI00193F1863|nr:ATP-binding protein [Bacillus sp. B15-48]MBM4763702.1 AAA family ATPase [Bacillus sp. B15-48]